MTPIIGIFENRETAEKYPDIIETAGHQFRVVLSVPQLLRYLDEHDVVVMVIGAQVPASEKLRIFGYVKRWNRSRCDIVEVYRDKPELPGCVHLREYEGEARILRVIEGDQCGLILIVTAAHMRPWQHTSFSIPDKHVQGF